MCVSCHQRTNPRDNSPATVLSSTLALSQVAWAHGDGSACRGRTLPHVKHRTGIIIAACGYAARRGRPGRGGRPQSPLRQHGDNAPASPSLSARPVHDPASLLLVFASAPATGAPVFFFLFSLFWFLAFKIRKSPTDSFASGGSWDGTGGPQCRHARALADVDDGLTLRPPTILTVQRGFRHGGRDNERCGSSRQHGGPPSRDVQVQCHQHRGRLH